MQERVSSLQSIQQSKGVTKFAWQSFLLKQENLPEKDFPVQPGQPQCLCDVQHVGSCSVLPAGVCSNPPCSRSPLCPCRVLKTEKTQVSSLGWQELAAVALDTPDFSDLYSQPAEQSRETANRDLGWAVAVQGYSWCLGQLVFRSVLLCLHHSRILQKGRLSQFL